MKALSNNTKKYIFLHCIILIYSMATICSKLAAQYQIASRMFIVYYIASLGCLFIYALLWQQIIKKMALTVAVVNKSMIIIWGMIWGTLIFNEPIKWNMILGTSIILVGVYLVVSKNE